MTKVPAGMGRMVPSIAARASARRVSEEAAWAEGGALPPAWIKADAERSDSDRAALFASRPPPGTRPPLRSDPRCAANRHPHHAARLGRASSEPKASSPRRRVRPRSPHPRSPRPRSPRRDPGRTRRAAWKVSEPTERPEPGHHRAKLVAETGELFGRGRFDEESQVLKEANFALQRGHLKLESLKVVH